MAHDVLIFVPCRCLMVSHDEGVTWETERHCGTLLHDYSTPISDQVASALAEINAGGK